MDKPVLLVVTDDDAVRAGLSGDLERRFGADYRVLSADSGESGLAVAERVRSEGGEVALFIIEESVVRLPAADVLTRAREVAPMAKRVLLIARGDWSAGHPAVSAMAMGQVDYHLYNPWYPLERILYPAVSDFLASWDKTHDAPVVPIRIVGNPSAVGSHELRDTLTRAAVPFWFHEPDSPEGRQVLEEVGEDGSRLPVLLVYDGTVLVDPALHDVWQALGVRTRIDVDSCDLVVIGAGPAGLAAAVYGASEGLETLVIEPSVPGGQAGTSSMIRNYLGFQRGISGDDLANRAFEQAWLFGTRFVLSQTAARLGTRDGVPLVTTSDGSEVSARAVVIATGVTWRRLEVPALEALVGAGVFYGAAGAEARAMQGRDVFVVGAGNSAGSGGDAPLEVCLVGDHARARASRCAPACRSTSSPRSSTHQTSRYVCAPRWWTEREPGRLESITLQEKGGGRREVVPASALFLLIGAEPRTEWLDGSVARDAHGFVLTGNDLLVPGGVSPAWPLERLPLLLETSMPGVFAAGDVRHRSIKRVAAAVGEGSTAIQLVHEYLSAGT